MKVVLAEKPSVARDLAGFLKASRRCDGYLEGGGYQVTWAFGHLVELVEPGDYDPALKRWTLDSLPFIPERFDLRVRGDDGAKKQFATIKRLFKAADSLICATDAGREGELIFRYILALTRCDKKPAERLWLSSLTSSAIGAAFRSIRPLSDYDNLYAAAKCRSQADWVVGLNATRNYTVRYRSVGRRGMDASSENRGKRTASIGLLWSLGRVQTPVLAMIVRRDDEIRTFRSRPFWELLTNYREVTFRFTGERFDKRVDAEQMMLQAAQHPLQIKKVQSRTEKSQPPQLYDLTELQRDMNRRLSISAADTLAAAQSLYEAKLITYPRTDSRYLTREMQKEVPSIFKQLAAIKPCEIGKLDLKSLPFSGRITNNAKVTDHHAIIPTGSHPASLSDRAKKVYDAILIRFIAAFYPACQKEVTVVDAEAGKVQFRARGVRVVIPGWTELYPRKTKSDDADEQLLPAFVPGESGPHQPSIKAGETTPPKHFTENTLLGAMDTAGKLVDEGELREALKEKGLGTPATRAATIETLLTRKYIDRANKNIIATDLGRYLIAIVKDRNLTSPELTGEWEAKLKQIETGRLSADVFMREIAEYTRSIVRSSDVDTIDHAIYGPCPRCGQPIIAGKHAFGCSGWKAGCDFVLQPKYRDAELSLLQIRELLQLGVTSEPVQLSSGTLALLGISNSGVLLEIPVPQGDEQMREGKSKPKSVARQRTGKTKNSSGDPTPRRSKVRASSEANHTGELGACPLCGSVVTETAKSYSCRRWSEGCALTIWKTIAGKRITAATAKKLLRDGQTATLKGFQSKAGKRFDAKLKLNDGKVEFDFS